jgi:hypothetical protein
MVLTEKQVLIFCSACRQLIGDRFISFEFEMRESLPSLHDAAMNWENTILSSVRRSANPRGHSFARIENPAFLVFCFALPWSTRYMKEGFAW